MSSDSNLPTRARHTVVLFAVALAVITYVDRVCISQSAPMMQKELGLSKIEMGYAFTAFGWAYALFEIPGGWLGDRWGARIILTLALLWWSVFTAWTAMAPASPLAGWLGIMGALALARFLLGVGEAVALPNFNRIVTDWLPAGERGLGIGEVHDHRMVRRPPFRGVHACHGVGAGGGVCTSPTWVCSLSKQASRDWLSLISEQIWMWRVRASSKSSRLRCWASAAPAQDAATTATMPEVIRAKRFIAEFLMRKPADRDSSCTSA